MKKSLIALSFGGLTIGITEFVMMGLLPDIASDMKVSIPVAGYLISAYALGVVIGAPLLVILGRNFPPKKMLLILAAMLAVFNALSIIAPTYNILFASRFLSGLPHGAFFGVGAVVASRLADKGKEAQAIAIMFSGLTLANLIGVPIGTYIGHNFIWRYTFVLIAVVGLLTFLFISLWMPHLDKGESVNMKKQLEFFKRREAWLIIGITAIGFGGLFAWISYIAPLLINVSKFAEGDVSYILILAGLGMVVGNFAGGKLADKYSPAPTTLALLFIMSVDLILVYFLSSNQYVSLFLTFLTGAISFSVIAPIQMLMIRTAKGAEMIASASLQGSFNIGNALGAFLGGLPLSAGYSYASPNLIGVGMSVIGMLITLTLIKTHKNSLKLQSA
ncbi:MFS transporter [Flavobacterium johnsoniae]|jgi:DHA1 family arabinose polymer transporter-like MFS transporter|uniref:MFS transporter, DHA1 family, arabinose polymer transporter n=2 Tax=Flavobacterium johnsoniae TaxID=986 RepID=A0A1M5KQ07_FLAJO|nr:MFS transporter [Flavobacterium johnsoniae]ABQ03223.1 major facilitator superfamily MFS_1 [Flavobacterium johnsoniae UW101]OXG01352.1 MFS transporter [Flavobacterium johnsoniae UW101]WQG79913.1 MFS transporter [Flavobacterium johnsoniae UW101]SHG54851.1 MFS transporter, DHA1 family, arabinose polymer transporter [Flavobacterium johnsoniae]SHL81641.1 MFS transporter, DHA1 family, arabinose polymer transporter [Flavobacterium johnsoniae]